MLTELLPRRGGILGIVLAAAVGCSAGGGAAGTSECEPSPVGTGPVRLRLERVATGLGHPVDFVPIPGTTDAWLIATQDGAVHRVTRTGEASIFLDLRSAVTTDPTSGLLGVALHPRFPNDPRVFVRYSVEHPPQTVLDEFWLDAADPSRLDATSGRRLVTIGRDTLGHDGGSPLFGPDGLLYLAVGDGGPLGDPKKKARDLGKLSGKILRLDVDGADPYQIPGSNPYVGVPGARAEIWASGLRNPWRASFDAATAALWIADVGENEREEIDRVEVESGGGADFGWSSFEGTRCFDPASGCDAAGLTPPVLEYDHVEPGGAPPGGPCAVVGGSVYRGCRIPAIRGAYFYGDFCAGFVRSFRYESGTVSDEKDWTDEFRAGGLDSVTAFGTDAVGELYVMDYVDGDVFRIAPATP